MRKVSHRPVVAPSNNTPFPPQQGQRLNPQAAGRFSQFLLKRFPWQFLTPETQKPHD